MGSLAQESCCDSHNVLQSHCGAAACPADGWTWELLLLCQACCHWELKTAEKLGSCHTVFKGLSEKIGKKIKPHLNVSGWATDISSHFWPYINGHMVDSHTIEAEDHEGWMVQ